MAGANGRGFNADERATAREAGPVTIGGETYHPRRLTNARLREIRKLAREGRRQSREASRASEEYQEAYDEVIAEGVDEAGQPAEGEALEKYARQVAMEVGASCEACAEINADSLRQQFHILLVTDAMQPVPETTISKWLEDELDSREVEALMSYLMRAEDPTQKEETGTATT